MSTILADLSDDEVVAEMQRRLARGSVGYAGLLAPHQLHYHGMWSRIVVEIADLSNQDFDHPYVRRLREQMHAIVDSGALPPEVFAINTTFHGKDTAFQNHQPRREEAA